MSASKPNVELSPLAIEVAACLSETVTATVPDLVEDCLVDPLYMAAGRLPEKPRVRIRNAIQELRRFLHHETRDREAIVVHHDPSRKPGYVLAYGLSPVGCEWVQANLDQLTAQGAAPE